MEKQLAGYDQCTWLVLYGALTALNLSYCLIGLIYNVLFIFFSVSPVSFQHCLAFASQYL